MPNKAQKPTATIQRRLLILVTVAVSLAVVLTCGVFVVDGATSMKAAKWEQLHSQADLLAINSAAAIEFADGAQADLLLAAFRVEPSVTAAGLYGADGTLVGGYPSRDQANASLAENTRAENLESFARPVVMNGETVGELRIVVDFSGVSRKILNHVRLSTIVGLTAWVASVVAAMFLQRGIVRPITNLAAVSRQVAEEENYALRVEGEADGELADLFRAFNGMLAQIEESKRELHEINDNLERRVVERTAELARALDAAQAASRAKSDFLANMSHEIRTPLNAIMGYADMLRRGWADSPEERDEMLDTVHSSGRHLMTVINDILDLSKIESGRVELEIKPESPHRILSEVVSLMRVPYREKNLTLDYNWEGPVPEKIDTDGSRLRQILINLLGNARKFTLEGGVRMIAKVAPGNQPSKFVIDVIDTGIGISPDKRDVIFDPFMQADTSVTRKFGGTGLGLSISRKLARLMGGDLTVDSTPGNGSDFRLTVSAGDMHDVRFAPLGAVSDVIPSPTGGAAAPADGGPELAGMRVLVVDDGDANRKLISLVLRRAGVEMSEACDGKEACDLVSKSRAFDAILLDMQMPVMDGYSAAGRMRELGVTTPIIALTAHAMKGDRERCLDAGCSDYMTKPVNADELLARMRELRRVVTRTAAPKAGVIDDSPIRSKLPVDDPEFAEIVVDFAAALRRETARLEAAVKARDPVATMTTAHWIKGSAGTAGFPCFTNPAAQVCQAVRNNEWNDIDRLLATIVDFSRRVEAPVLAPV